VLLGFATVAQGCSFCSKHAKDACCKDFKCESQASSAQQIQNSTVVPVAIVVSVLVVLVLIAFFFIRRRRQAQLKVMNEAKGGMEGGISYPHQESEKHMMVSSPTNTSPLFPPQPNAPTERTMGSPSNAQFSSKRDDFQSMYSTGDFDVTSTEDPKDYNSPSSSFSPNKPSALSKYVTDEEEDEAPTSARALNTQSMYTDASVFPEYQVTTPFGKL
jgi:hypothetical protein